jgi:OmpA-OmpF porin, OOP family
MTEATLAEAAAALMPETELTNMLETAGHPAPDTWDEALTFGLEALRRLPLSKISVAAEGSR